LSPRFPGQENFAKGGNIQQTRGAASVGGWHLFDQEIAATPGNRVRLRRPPRWVLVMSH
jgi:hypothetical protein